MCCRYYFKCQRLASRKIKKEIIYAEDFYIKTLMLKAIKFHIKSIKELVAYSGWLRC